MTTKTKESPEIDTYVRDIEQASQANRRALWQDVKGLGLAEAMSALFAPLPQTESIYLTRDLDGAIVERGRQQVRAARFVPIKFVLRSVDDLYHVILRPGQEPRIHGHEDEPLAFFVAGASDRPAEFRLTSLQQPGGLDQTRSAVVVKWSIALRDLEMSQYSYGNLQKIDEDSKAAVVARVEALPLVPTYLLYGGSVGQAVMAALWRLETDVDPDLALDIEQRLAAKFGGVQRQQVDQQAADPAGYHVVARAMAQAPAEVNWLPLPGRGTAELRVVPRLQTELLPVGEVVSLADLTAIIE